MVRSIWKTLGGEIEMCFSTYWASPTLWYSKMHRVSQKGLEWAQVHNWVSSTIATLLWGLVFYWPDFGKHQLKPIHSLIIWLFITFIYLWYNYEHWQIYCKNLLVTWEFGHFQRNIWTRVSTGNGLTQEGDHR